jgi:hypothetical protein
VIVVTRLLNLFGSLVESKECLGFVIPQSKEEGITVLILVVHVEDKILLNIWVFDPDVDVLSWNINLLDQHELISIIICDMMSEALVFVHLINHMCFDRPCIRNNMSLSSIHII